ncbi:MAG TPA: rod shape-determining protein MreD [Polyangiaceae bacterium]|nr:rod shape-determining protein MreD [Polyangiaceae bacterium]
MRNALFLGVGLLLLVVQGNLHRLLGHIPIAGITPNLVLPLILFMGVHEYSVVRGAALAAALGYALDLFAGAPVGLFTFITVSIFVLARAAGVRLAAQTVLTQLALAFGFAIFESVTVLMLVAIFGRDPHSPKALLTVVLPHAAATAMVSPLVFRLAERLHQATITVPRPDGGAR